MNQFSLEIEIDFDLPNSLSLIFMIVYNLIKRENVQLFPKLYRNGSALLLALE